jgi:hypothetical protein
MGSWTGWHLSTTPQPFYKKWGLYNTTNTYTLSVGPPLLGQTGPKHIDVQWTAGQRGADFNSEIDEATVASGRLSASGHILVYKNEKFMIADLDMGTGNGSRRSAIARTWSGGAPAGSRYFFRQEPGDYLPAIYTPTGSHGVWPGLATDYFGLYAILEDNRAPQFFIETAGNPTSTTPSDEPMQLGSIQPSFVVQFSDLDRLEGYNDYPSEITMTLYRWNGSTWVEVNAETHYVGGSYDMPLPGEDIVEVELRVPSGVVYDEIYRVHVNGRDELGEPGSPWSNTEMGWLSQFEFTAVSGGRLESVSVS